VRSLGTSTHAVASAFVLSVAVTPATADGRLTHIFTSPTPKAMPTRMR
jgi:hypothetical protein